MSLDVAGRTTNRTCFYFLMSEYPWMGGGVDAGSWMVHCLNLMGASLTTMRYFLGKRGHKRTGKTTLYFMRSAEVILLVGWLLLVNGWWTGWLPMSFWHWHPFFAM